MDWPWVILVKVETVDHGNGQEGATKRSFTNIEYPDTPSWASEDASEVERS